MGACRCPAPRARSPRRRPQKAPVPSSGRGRELGSGPGPGLGIESGSVANGPRLVGVSVSASGFQTFHLPARTTRRITAVSRGSIGGRAHRWATGRARNVAAARSWEARALTSAPEASSASHSSPRCVHERLDPKKPVHALGGCVRLLFGPGRVRCTAPTARGSRSPAEGGKPCGGSRHSCTKPCLAAITEPPRVLLRTLVAPCIRAVVPDERRGAGVHFFCRHTTECAGAQLGPELARRMFGGSAPRLGGSARLEALSQVTASQRASSSPSAPRTRSRRVLDKPQK